MSHPSVFCVRCMLIAVAAVWIGAGSARGQSTAFTYQGRLQNAGVGVTGVYDFRFGLWDAATGGNVLNGGALCVDNVTVSGGLVTVPLDFGSSFATTSARWLEVQVRADTGLGCGNATGFVTLTPRQSVTPAPAATHANSAFSLGAPNGSPATAVSVDNAGNVGVGTTTPGKKLTVAGDMEMGTSAGDYRAFRIGGGNSSGFLYGSYPALGDGIHMGYNIFADAGGVFRTVNSGGQTSRLSVGYGYVAIATGGIGAIPINRLIATTAGNIGIGTDSPTDRLEVRGNIRLGGSGQYFAPAGEENLRIIRGVVDANGNIIVGSGFTARHDGPTGFYHITYNTPFSGPPAVTITVDGSSAVFAYAETDGVLADQLEVFIRSGGGSYTNGPFHFIAVGPR